MSRLLPLLVLALLPACTSVYYDTMETFGIEKRDILKDRIEDGRDAQQQAKTEFQTALQAFKAATGFQGGDLEALHDKLDGRLKGCEASAGRVREEIDDIEEVADDLFAEWKHEAGEYSSKELRAQSEKLLRDTKERYGTLLSAMKRAEATMAPVLDAFRDQVLFLKHNLNAQAIASLAGNVAAIEDDVARLVADMETSIAEADSFIKSMGSPGPDAGSSSARSPAPSSAAARS
jgi:ElaB/YqjD/DUF883 family membrane-anchored ribosome-binding protein